MQSDPAVRRQPSVSTVIESIAAGLSAALARPWLIVIPLLLDFYFWLGWRVIPLSLTDPLRREVLKLEGADAERVAEALQDLGRTDLTAMIALFVPSLLGGANREQVYEIWARPVVQPAWWLTIFGVGALFLITCGTLAVFSVALADTALERNRSFGVVARAIGVAWPRLIAFWLVVLAAVIMTLIPVAFLGTIVQLAGINAVSLLGSLFVAGGFAVFIMLYFALDAIVVTEVGPFEAAKQSITVVRANFWPTIGFILASIIIMTALPDFAGHVVNTLPGLLIALIAHAYVACGLGIAGMIFFSERLHQTRSSARPILQHR